MEALVRRGLLVLFLLSCFGASSRTANFVVTAPTKALANEICQTAERCRRDLAVEWLGHELPRWSQPCPVVAQVNPTMGAGGMTQFVFDQSRPRSWRMSVQGSRERVLDSVIPHEVTHTIFATHFGQPLPRWADEGACTAVEHVSERSRHQQFLLKFLTSGQGIAFNRMFAMREYPQEMLPLYSQGYSVARYLIERGGKRRFVDYIGEGLQTNNWTAATDNHYGVESLGDLQGEWLSWVKRGSPSLKDNPTQLAGRRRPRIDFASASKNAAKPASRNASEEVASSSGDSWYARQSSRASTDTNPRKEPIRSASRSQGRSNRVLKYDAVPNPQEILR